MNNRVSPRVSLLQKDPSSPVACHATGFYPSGVTINWQKNGQDHDEDVDLGGIVPNEDGTFQSIGSSIVKAYSPFKQLGSMEALANTFQPHVTG
ncbi:MHC class I antigen [Labeo rohita]|uniref:MHC class I antigen n=1 Tax=Labeo rohita TaxID=84645 RepID=A0A498P2I4_LABRO|nr:MHC class I antigen [Labeo rohita]